MGGGGQWMRSGVNIEGGHECWWWVGGESPLRLRILSAYQELRSGSLFLAKFDESKKKSKGAAAANQTATIIENQETEAKPSQITPLSCFVVVTLHRCWVTGHHDQLLGLPPSSALHSDNLPLEENKFYC
ncbi:hypothetical protein RJT34_07904 [Clitoria ternatea]|uniref:Uncharacterized protein n=1 Tax=Clitoria ternatea TaxID=43366 RepID=A0AAN9K341_CLITE